MMTSDADLQQEVNDDLNWDAAVDAANLAVTAQAGVVTITGKVRHFSEKWEAERLAETLPRVKAVVIHIQVVPIDAPDDAAIAAAAAGAVAAASYLPADAVNLQVESGWITLSGSVPWDFQRRNVETAVRSIGGVRGLTNDIGIVTAKIPAATIKTRIEAALRRQFDSEDQTIGVQVRGDEVTLTGTVTNGWQRHLARDSAWNAAGVRKVKDDLVVGY
jgi:osmotically-inducible protein OsmY